DDAGLRPAEGLARRAGHDVGAFGEGILELPAADQAKLVSTVEKHLGAPFADDLFDLADRQREQGHRESERHDARPNERRQLAEEIEVDGEFLEVEGNIDDFQTPRPGWADGAV